MLLTFGRTELLLGREGLTRLANSTVAVFGLGGVGSFAVEALARSGVGHLVLVDHDRVAASNINRQLIATHDTVGEFKVEVMARRIKTINPEADVEAFPEFFDGEKVPQLLSSNYHYVVDAIDTVSAKLALIVGALELGIPLVSSMGAGNRLDPGAFQVADISQTHSCPLARVVRKELRRRGITSGVRVVFSQEPPRKPLVLKQQEEPALGRNQVPGSVSFVPPVAGFLLAGVVVRDLLGMEG